MAKGTAQALLVGAALVMLFAATTVLTSSYRSTTGRARQL